MRWLILIIVLLTTTLLKAQHGVSPGYAFINEQNRQVTITIFNQADEEKEADIAFNFGYPAYDSLGNLQMFYNDSITASKYSIDDVVRIFPKKVILPGRSQQYVKFIFSGNFDNIPDGTKWTRISVKTLIKKQQIDTTETEGVQVGIDIAYETSTILMLQKGNLTSKLELGEVEIKQDSVFHYFLIDTKKIGNSPYIGLFEMNIYNESNDKFEPILGSYVIYFDESKPSIRVPKSDLPDGKYTASLRIHNERPDIDKERIIKTEPIIKDFDFTITGNGFITDEER